MIKVRYSSELYHHGTKGMKWGVKNGPPYPLDSKSAAKNVYAAAVKSEPRITEDIVNAARSSGVKIHGLNHRLKTIESINRKIDKGVIEKSLSVSDSAGSIRDAVRYTTISDTKNFVDRYFRFKQSLEAAGYKEVRCENYFRMYRQGKVKHKSVQSQFKSPYGYIFEVQFQTPESQKAKDKKVPLYEERRQVGISEARAKELENQMVELAERVPDPRNVSRIKSY